MQVCGLVLLTRGRREEKIRFIFGLHADVDAAVVTRVELEALEAALAAADQGLHTSAGSTNAADSEMKRKCLETLDDIFGATEKRTGSDATNEVDGKIGFDAFRRWLVGGDDDGGGSGGGGGVDDSSRLQSLQQRKPPSPKTPLVPRNSERLCVTRWLLHDHAHVTLSNDDVTPTFYQTLAGVTHLEESDIIELEKRYWMLKAGSKTGRYSCILIFVLVTHRRYPSLTGLSLRR